VRVRVRAACGLVLLVGPTVAAIVGIAAMIYGLAAGVMIVLNREDGGSPD
jgi:disulfide bond formation protein DsbB